MLLMPLLSEYSELFSKVLSVMSNDIRESKLSEEKLAKIFIKFSNVPFSKKLKSLKDALKILKANGVSFKELEDSYLMEQLDAAEETFRVAFEVSPEVENEINELKEEIKKFPGIELVEPSDSAEFTSMEELEDTSSTGGEFGELNEHKSFKPKQIGESEISLEEIPDSEILEVGEKQLLSTFSEEPSSDNEEDTGSKSWLESFNRQRLERIKGLERKKQLFEKQNKNEPITPKKEETIYEVPSDLFDLEASVLINTLTKLGFQKEANAVKAIK